MKVNSVPRDFKEAFLLDGLRLVAQPNSQGTWYIYLVHDTTKSKFPVTTITSAPNKELAIHFFNQIKSILQNYEFPRATKTAIDDLLYYLRDIKINLRVTNPVSSKSFNQYLYTILWSSTREDGQALDSYYDIDDFAEEAIKRASKDWEKFKSQAGFLLDGLDLGQVAHDFWLTRNRHGAGFWDGDYEDVVADKLTKIAHSFKEQTAYIGDDDFIYLE